MAIQGKNRTELYADFIEFVQRQLQTEQSISNRRIYSVFFWCFLMPLLVVIGVNLLVKFEWLPTKARSSLDSIVLLFPILYSLYFLGMEVLRDLPHVFRHGGMANFFRQSVKDGTWRESTSNGMKTSVAANPEQWQWIVSNFRLELEALQYRNRYLTALAGAVFFLLQGLDIVDSRPDLPSQWSSHMLVMFTASLMSELVQLIGLILFLVLFYLGGTQNHRTLARYLGCAELVSRDLERPNHL